ncbi:MAG: hypothetical protein U0T81_18400 [Saprospiraceae bacterium]
MNTSAAISLYGVLSASLPNICFCIATMSCVLTDSTDRHYAQALQYIASADPDLKTIWAAYLLYDHRHSYTNAYPPNFGFLILLRHHLTADSSFR